MDAETQKDHDALYPMGVLNYQPGIHRAEAKLYLPTTDEQRIEAIENGTDPYTGRWLGIALYALGICMMAYASAEMAGWV